MSVITKVLGRIQLRGANTSETLSKNETLLDRELYIEKGVGVKVGDGIKQYNNLPYLAKFGGGDSVGLGGTNYVFVKGDGTPTENYAELMAAYETAKGMSPGENNVITVVISPGIYEGADIDFDTDYIDFTSLTGQPDVIIPSILTFGISTVTGIKSTVSGSFKSRRGTFINCVGGNSSFHNIGGSGELITCYNCLGERDSFQIITGSGGVFYYCRGENNCFKESSGTCGGIVCYSCYGGLSSFFLDDGFAWYSHGATGSQLTSSNSVFSSINRIPV